MTTLVPQTGAVEEYKRYKVASALYEMYDVKCEIYNAPNNIMSVMLMYVPFSIFIFFITIIVLLM